MLVVGISSCLKVREPHLSVPQGDDSPAIFVSRGEKGMHVFAFMCMHVHTCEEVRCCQMPSSSSLCTIF